jgi:disulfide bond formation protein DsbB
MFLSILSLILQKHTNLLRILVILIGLGFVSEITLAFYHVLIEHHVIEETTKCAVMLNLADDPNIALQQIMNTKSESCAEPEFIFLKLSMAEWNLLSSLAITIIVFYHRIRNATRR